MNNLLTDKIKRIVKTFNYANIRFKNMGDAYSQNQ